MDCAYSLPYNTKTGVFPGEEHPLLKRLGLENSQENEDLSSEENMKNLSSAKKPSKEFGPKVHPCFNTRVNKTVITSNGEKVLCLVPSEAELVKYLKESGGFNKHYVAVTEEEAEENFEDPLNPIVSSKPVWLTVTGRRRRFSDEDDYYRMGNTKGALDNKHPKRSVSGLKSCVEQGKRNSIGMIQLCGECGWVTKLPEDKFPRYINELICGKDGNTFSHSPEICNMFQGECIQGSLTQDLLERTDRYEKINSPDPQYHAVYKQVWQPYSQAIRSCCQCQNF